MSEEKVYAKGFKGFDPGMKCLNKQYAENTVFEEDGGEICHEGVMHFCENPLDVLEYYPLLNDACEFNELATVEALAEVETEGNKSASRKLKIGVKLNLKGFVEAAVNFSLEWMKKVDFTSRNSSTLAADGGYSTLAVDGEYNQLAAAGYGSTLAAAGYGSTLAAAGEYNQLAAAGEYNQLAAAGYGSKLAAAGDGSTLAAAGEYNQLAASGDGSKLAAAGYGSKLAAAGKYSTLAAAGYGSTLAAAGDKCVIASLGCNGRVKGALGCFIACAEWVLDDGNWGPVSFPSAQVDGKKIKADTWYTVRNGKFVEVKDE